MHFPIAKGTNGLHQIFCSPVHRMLESASLQLSKGLRRGLREGRFPTEMLLSRGVGAHVWAKGREWLMCITVQKPWENHQQTNIPHTPGILEPTAAVEPLSYTTAYSQHWKGKHHYLQDWRRANCTPNSVTKIGSQLKVQIPEHLPTKEVSLTAWIAGGSLHLCQLILFFLPQKQVYKYGLHSSQREEKKYGDLKCLSPAQGPLSSCSKLSVHPPVLWRQAGVTRVF